LAHVEHSIAELFRHGHGFWRVRQVEQVQGKEAATLSSSRLNLIESQEDLMRSGEGAELTKESWQS